MPVIRSILPAALFGVSLFIEAAQAEEPIEFVSNGEAAQTAREWMATEEFNGVILVNWFGKDLIALADGVADPVTGRQATMEPRFQTGSIEKYFASAAVFALVEEGKLDLDAPISAYLPDYRADTADRRFATR